LLLKKYVKIKERGEPALSVQYSVQERHGPVGACPEEGRKKNDPRDGTYPHKEGLRAGAAQHEEGKALGRPESSLLVSTVGL